MFGIFTLFDTMRTLYRQQVETHGIPGGELLWTVHYYIWVNAIIYMAHSVTNTVSR